MFSDPIVKDQGRGATPGGMAASSTPVSSSSMMAGESQTLLGTVRMCKVEP